MGERAGTPQCGADILVQCLLNHGVEVVFAYPGGASMPIHQALTRFSTSLRTILPRHEQGGGFAAEGYARSSGKVGVCVATSGPGATNLVTCLADAKMDSVPLVAITGQVRTSVIGTDAFQETPIVYGGGGIIASGAAPHLRAFAERTGIPVALTLLGLGGFPSEHFLCLQMLGMHGTIYANYAINDADLLLALGVRFDDRVTGKLSEFVKHGKIVHIDIDPSEINKNKVAHLPIFGDINDALQDLIALLDEEPAGITPRNAQFADWIRQIEVWRETEA